MLALALLGFVLAAVALFALGVWYAAVLAADLSRASTLLIAIVFRTARIKLAERDEARQRLIKGQRPRDSNDDRASELVQRSAQGRPLTARTEPA